MVPYNISLFPPEHKSCRANFPNIVSSFFYSRLLEHSVLCKVSTYAMREIEAAGGWDEYMLISPAHQIPDGIAAMWRRKVQQAWIAKGQAMKKDEKDGLVGMYGEAYGE